MSKKVVGLVLSVALLMVVLSGCFLLPKPDIMAPTVTILSPTNGAKITIPSGKMATVPVKVTVAASSPIGLVQVTLTSTSMPARTKTAKALSGGYGSLQGTFVATFTNLKSGDYNVNVEARSKCPYPVTQSSMFSITATTVYENPVVGAITLTPNYQGKYYVTGSPIQFSAQVTNPNSAGTPEVVATVSGKAATKVSVNNGVYTFIYTPTAAGTWTFAVSAVLTVDSKTYSGSNSTTEHVYVKPAVSNLQGPEDYSVATTNPSFTFTTTDGVTAYLSVNGSTHAPYTSGSAITNLVPNQWNTLTLTFQDPWNNPMSTTSTVHILGVQSSNSADTPYVFLIDKNGHVVNTNDWIHKNAGDKIDLYGYILQGKNAINSYDIVESYYTNENLTTMSYTGSVASETSLNTDKVPLRLVAYLFNEQASDTFIKFNINVNNSAAAFLRYDVAPVAANSINVSVSPVGGTYESVPATLNVTVNSVQPLTSIILGQPFKVGEPFDGYATTTAYSNSQNKTNVMTFDHHYIMPVSTVEASDIAAYGTASGTFPFDVAFYGPSGTYQIGATVTAVANQIATATTNYVVQADTAAPTIKIVSNTTNATTIGGRNVYYGPMGVTATITDDHAIYWAKFVSSNVNLIKPTIVYFDNNASITNYGNIEATTTATVTFGHTGPFTVWAVASDKHFDPTAYSTGNTANSLTSITGIYDNTPPTASLVGGKYDIDATSEYYSFTIEATDGNGVGLAGTADVVFTPVNGGATVTRYAHFVPQTPEYYKVLVNTDSLQNIRYSVAVSVMDKLYNKIPSSATALRANHITTIETGYITVNHTYPKVALYNLDGNTENALGSGNTPTALKTDVFRIKINDPDFQWSWVDASNYKSYLKISLYGPNYGFEPMTKLVRIVHQTDSATGFFDVEIPEVYFNVAEGTNTVATSTIQVDVYNGVQDDKALFGRATGKFIPASLFASEGEPVINFNSKSVSLNGENSTPVVVPNNPSDFEVTFALNGMTNKEGMSLTFYANDTKITEVPASNTVVTLPVPINPDWQTIKFWVRYAPSSTRTFNSVSVSDVNAYGYHYDYTIGTARVLGDTVPPAATITANGVNVSNTSTILKVNKVDLGYGVNGVAFYRHDDLNGYYADLSKNTTINGTVTLTTANGQTTFATATLGATDSLSATSADFAQAAATYIIFSQKLSEATEAGIYNIKFTANDPFQIPIWNKTTSATVVVDLASPALSTVTLNGLAASDTTNGKVPEIANGDTLAVMATDDTGVESATMTVTNLIYPSASNTTSMSLANNGIGVFNIDANAAVTLPTYVGAEFQNLPYEVTFSAEDIAGRSATEVTRLFVTNVDHNPMVNNITAIAQNKVLVVLNEPMWVEGFKKFTAHVDSTSYSGTITSANIAATNNAIGIWSYGGKMFASQFVVTFTNNIWSSSLLNPFPYDVRKQLTNVRMLNASDKPIVDLAGNEFTMPVNTTVLPILTVTPLSTTTGKGWNVTFTVSATSPAAGIEKIVGNFYGQTRTIYAATGTMTFTAPTTTGTETAYFTAYDNSVNHNTANATANVYVENPPTVTISSTYSVVKGGTSFTATVVAKDNGGTALNLATFKATFDGVPMTVLSSNTTTSVATYTVTATPSTSLTSGSYNITASIEDSIANVGTTTSPTSIFVDNDAPDITVEFAGTEPGATYPATLGVATETVYAKTAATLIVKALDNYSATTTLVGTAASGSVKVSFSATDASGNPSTTTAISTTGTYTITVTATDFVGNVATVTRYLHVVVDSSTPIATVTVPTGTITAASPTEYATYTLFATVGLANYDLTINGVSVSPVEGTSASSKSTVDLANVNLHDGTNTAVISATSKTGVSTTSTYTINVDFFKIASATRSTSATGSPVVITFSSTLTTLSSFSTSDITLYNNSLAITYVASNVKFTTDTASITKFYRQSNNGPVYSKDLPSGTYTVTVGTSIKSSSTVWGQHSASNNGTFSFTLP